MPLNHRGIGLILFVDFLFLYILIMLFKYTSMPAWLSIFLVISFVAYNVFILYQALNYIDTNDDFLAMPIIAIVISSLFLLIIVAIVMAIIFAFIMGAKSEAGKK